MNNAPFLPEGLTQSIIGNTAAPAPIQLQSFTPNPNQVEVVNSSGVLGFLFYGPDSASVVTAAAAGAPILGTGAKCIVLLPGSDKVHSLPPNGWYTVLSTAACQCYLTPGDGL